MTAKWSSQYWYCCQLLLTSKFEEEGKWWCFWRGWRSALVSLWAVTMPHLTLSSVRIVGTQAKYGVQWTQGRIPLIHLSKALDSNWGSFTSRLPSGVINSKKMCKAIGNMPDILLNLRINMWGVPTFFVAGFILGGKTVSNWLQPLYLYHAFWTVKPLSDLISHDSCDQKSWETSGFSQNM